MSKVAHYLQEHLLGEVSVSPDARLHFAHDASILRMVSAIIVYPRVEDDVRKTLRFSWQLAERGRVVPITARGAGSDTSGAAIGSGILLAFTAHMNKILALDPRKQSVTVEPGITYDKLEQTLYTHGIFLPPYPSARYATVGGGLANNVMGEKSVKYGVTLDYVDRLRVVLSNGEVIETGSLKERELSQKLGLSSLEGEIYRAVDSLLEENWQVITDVKTRIKTKRNVAGYNLWDIRKNNEFDLTPLFVGSQGTLGVITEASFSLADYNPVTSLVHVSLSKLSDLEDLLPQILKLEPSILEMVNGTAIQEVYRLNPNQLAEVLGHSTAEIHLFVEFDDAKEAPQKKGVKHLADLANKVGGTVQVADSIEEQEKLWKIRQSVATILSIPQGQAKAVPVAEDVAVPISEVTNFLQKAYEIYREVDLAPAAWGHIGDGVIRMHPVLDLANVGDRQKLFKIANEIYNLAIQLGGTTSAAAGDGRVRASYLEQLYGSDYYQLLLKIKKIFDPYGILNPGVKTASQEEVVNLLRTDYNLHHRHEHLPRS